MLRTPRTFGEWIATVLLVLAGLYVGWYWVIPFVFAVLKQALATLLILAAIGFGIFYAIRSWWKRET